MRLASSGAKTWQRAVFLYVPKLSITSVIISVGVMYVHEFLNCESPASRGDRSLGPGSAP